MILKKLKFKNFFSVGNDFLEIDLQKNKQTVIFGKNGNGKSTMLSAITFALFGKTIKKVTKAQIVNSINNKNCLTEIELISNQDIYLIRRGIKPNIFEIYKNSELVDQSSVNDYQDYLEEFILKCSYRTFCQTSIISIENYKPFMSLTPAERRDFIEDILDIKVFSVMNTLIKSKVTKNKDELKLQEVSIRGYKEKLVIQKNNITNLELMLSTGIQALEDKLDEYNNELISVEEELNHCENKIESLSETRNQLKEIYKKRNFLNTQISDINSQLRNSEKDSKFFENNDSCSVCRQPLSKHHTKTILETHRTTSDALISSRDILTTQLSEYASYDTDNDAYSKLESENNSKISVANSTISRLNRLISDTNKEKLKLEKSENIEELKSELKSGAKEAMKIQDRITKLNEESGYNTIMLELFKDSGIKSKIVLQYIPIINKLANQYLEKLDFFVSFNLDNEFNETIKSRHRDDFTYSSFSMGEKQRIDLALMFTFRQLALMRNSFSCNILCMDELMDASVDFEGVELLMDIFDSIEFDKTNLFIISHGNKDRFEERFAGSIEFYKRDGFSQTR